MSALHKVKAYFGMVPMDDYDYDDDYATETEPRNSARSSRHNSGYASAYRDEYAAEDHDDYRSGYGDSYREPVYAGAREDDARYEARSPRLESARAESRLEPLGRSHVSGGRGSAPTRGALAVDTRRVTVADDASALSKISTLRPRDYSEARTIGERFRDGSPVIMDLVDMSNADAKRLVDFAAGLAFALRGSFDKVATKVFLLTPSDIDVSPEERRRIAEKGFYSAE